MNKGDVRPDESGGAVLRKRRKLMRFFCKQKVKKGIEFLRKSENN